MAQVLKDELRQAIVAAAKNEFYLHGLQGASMRKIAKEARMSTGNVYRYFKNKEALAQEILADTLQKLNCISDRLMQPAPEEQAHAGLMFLRQRFALFVDQLVEVFMEDQQEFIILMNHSHYAQQLILWFKNTLTQLVNHWFPAFSSNQQVELLCHMLAESIIAGLNRGFKESVDSMTPHEIRWTMGTYFHLYTLMMAAGGEHYEKV